MVATVVVANNYTIFVRLTCGFDAHQHIQHPINGAIFMPKIHKEKENKQMSVIIKLNGIYIGTTTMSPSEIRNAENAGFTILRNGKEK